LLTERADPQRVEALIREEIDRLATTGPTSEELSRAIQQVRSMFLFGLESNLPRSTQLSAYELFWGDANGLNEEVDRYAAVTAERVRDAVATYLTPRSSSTVFVKPKASEPPAQPAASAKEVRKP